MTVIEFLDKISADRKLILETFHELIIANDSTVTPVIKQMMGKDMILYEDRGYMKYGLADTKNYFSLHCLPIYCVPELHAKYQALFPLAKFQKGCINFNNAAEMPPPVLTAFLQDCAHVNIAELLSNRKKKPAAKTISPGRLARPAG
jgi:hypothetical protein